MLGFDHLASLQDFLAHFNLSFQKVPEAATGGGGGGGGGEDVMRLMVQTRSVQEGEGAIELKRSPLLVAAKMNKSLAEVVVGV